MRSKSSTTCPRRRASKVAIARRVVLVSDMQQGSRLNALADYPWPEDVRARAAAGDSPAKRRTPACIGWPSDGRPNRPAKSRELRVRVSNDADSAVDRVRTDMARRRRTSRSASRSTAYVPAGESRVVRVSRRPNDEAASRLRLSGDARDFDNTLYFAARAEDRASRSSTWAAIAADDPQGLRYYLERALTDGLAQPVKLVAAVARRAAGDRIADRNAAGGRCDRAVRRADRRAAQYVESGGTCCSCSRRLSQLLDSGYRSLAEPRTRCRGSERRQLRDAGPDRFDHPLFAPMAGPHFNDFTQIRFWKYRQFKAEQLGGANVVARFENGDPALVEWRLGKGRLYRARQRLAAGRQPIGPLWKFVLLVSALVEGRRAGESDRVYFVVNEPVPLGEREEVCGERPRSPSQTEPRCMCRRTPLVRRHRFAGRVFDHHGRRPAEVLP